MIFSLDDKTPSLGKDNYIAHNATVIGDVELADNVSIWFNVVIRADGGKVTIGEGSNIQDGSVVHVDDDYPVTIGKGVTVGHKVMIHGCTIGDNSLIGINAVVLDGAVIGKHCLIGANTLVPSGMVIPDGSMVMGSPAKIKRELTDKEVVYLHRGAQHYVDNGRRFSKGLKQVEIVVTDELSE